MNAMYDRARITQEKPNEKRDPFTNADPAKKPEPGAWGCQCCHPLLAAVIQSDYTEVKTCC